MLANNLGFIKLDQFIPINNLPKSCVAKLESKTILKRYGYGDVVFRIGDIDNNHLFLIKGEIATVSKDGRRSYIKAGSARSCHAISDLKPRLYNATAISDEVIIAEINASTLDKYLATFQVEGELHDDESTEAINREEVDTKWFLSLLKQEIFYHLPATKIDRLYEKLVELEVFEGEIIFHQGEKSDYYYFIKEGRCQKSYNDTNITEEIEELNGFGGGALTSQKTRKYNVSMLSDGKLMYLSKSDYLSLIETTNTKNKNVFKLPPKKVIVITSGKGGVGKTTTSASIGTGLALKGYKTVIIDFDIGLRNLDLTMGCEKRVVFDFLNLIDGEVEISQALIQDYEISNLFILPASQNGYKNSLTKEAVGKVIYQLVDKFDYIICDSPAGIESGALVAMYFADEAIIVANPEVPSIRDANRIQNIIDNNNKNTELYSSPIEKYILINRYSDDLAKKGVLMNSEEIKSLLPFPLLGIIPESENVLKASNRGRPIILNKSSKVSMAFSKAVDNFLALHNRNFKN